VSIEDVLDGKRLKRKYKKHNLYLTMWDKDGKLYALQTSVSDRNINQDAQTLASIEWATRAATLVVRRYGVDYAVAELENCGMGKHTLPAILASAIREHCGMEERDV
jgi:hypothetical protein